MRTPSVTVVSAAALAAVMTACGGTASTPGSTQDGGAAATTPAPAQTASPTAGADGAGAAGTLCAVGRQPCEMEAGTYTAAPFEPNFAFTIDEAWMNDRAYADGGGISQGIGGIYWLSGATAGTVAGQEVEIGASVDEFVAFLQSLEAAGMTVSDPTEVAVDGSSGQQVDVESNDVEAPGLIFIAEDEFHLVPDEKARFIVVDHGGETVAFIIDSFAAGDFDEWVETAQPVIDSISWQ